MAEPLSTRPKTTAKTSGERSTLNPEGAEENNPPSVAAGEASGDEEDEEVGVREGEELPFEEFTELPALVGQYLYRYIRDGRHLTEARVRHFGTR